MMYFMTRSKVRDSRFLGTALSLLTIITLLGGGCDGTIVPGGSSCQTPSNAASFAQQVLTLTNAERANVGLAALAWDNTLAQVAGNYACDMIDRNFFAHDDPDGQNVGDRATAAGYTWIAIGENLASGHQTPAAVVAGWMNSATHRDNILSATFTALGVGYREGGTFGFYWVQVFATPP